MDAGRFYFLKDQYFVDFPDPYLMQNHESIGGILHDRPCFFAFADSASGLFWMIPFSSKTDKYRKIYQSKVQRSGRCDTIAFGKVLGYEKAFLIQNMAPVSQEYIQNEYIDPHSSKPVQVDGVFERELIQKAKKVLALQRRGARLIFPDVFKIERSLLGQES